MRKFILMLALIPFGLWSEEVTLLCKEYYTFYREDLQKIKNVFHGHSFIETGTAGGETCELAAKIFPEVHSVEIYESNYLIAKKRLSPYKHVHLYLGDTLQLLQDMIHRSSGPRIFWLDAHCSGEGTGGTPGFNPIPHELNIIKAFGSAEDVILIDDLRGMYVPGTKEKPPVKQVADQVKEMDSRYEFYTLGDMAIIFNRDFHPHITVSPLVQACTKSFLFDPTNESPAYMQEIIQNELFGIAAGRPDSAEAKNIAKFHQRFYEPSTKNGGETVYLLWKALFELGNHYYADAANHFQELLSTPLKHWRVSAYLTRALILNGQIAEAREVFQNSLQEAYVDYPEPVEAILRSDWLNFLK